MKTHDEPKWGDAPIGDVLARLIAQRYPPKPGEAIAVDVDEDERFVELVLAAERHRYRIRVRYLRAAADRDPWMLMVDALDALFGTMLENDRDYRTLPQGTDVEFAGAFFAVEVEHTVPDLEKLADQLLSPRES